MEPGKELATVPREKGGILLPRIEVTDISQAMLLAGHLAKSGVLGKTMTPEVAFAIMMVGSELGIRPMTALRTIYLVEGRPYMASSLLQALVLSSGQADYFEVKESTATRCTVITMRKGTTNERMSVWDIERATKAGLMNKPTYQKHPTEMLRHRAIGELANDVYPDICLNIGTTDELADTPAAAGIIDVEARDITDQEEIAAPPVMTEHPDGSKSYVSASGKTVIITPPKAKAEKKASAKPSEASPPPASAPEQAPASAAKPAKDPNSKLSEPQLKVFWHRARKAAVAAGFQPDLQETAIKEVLTRHGFGSVSSLTMAQATSLIDVDGWHTKLTVEMEQIKAMWSAPEEPGFSDE